MGRPRIDPVPGEEYGRLIILGFSHIGKHGQSWWRARCRCGKETVVRAHSVRRGRTRSCGCLAIDAARETIRFAVSASRQRNVSAAHLVKTTGKKRCSRALCTENNPQPIGNFRKSDTPLGVKSECKTCESERQTMAKVGISLATRNKAIESQGGKCANPRCSMPAMHADHNHETGRFRAVLCRACNTAEGLLRDLDRIRGLLEYRLHHDAIDYPNEKIS